MANSLLDFVMSLVRDPDAAAQYAADPAQAIADANLTDVTSADVNQLIPVVSESLSSAVPATGGESLGLDGAPNVWASGAATEAFDAFDAQLPQQVVDDPQGAISELISSSDHAVIDTALSELDNADVPTVAGLDEPGLQLDAPVVDDAELVDAALDSDWAQQFGQEQTDQPSASDDLGFDDLI